MKPAGTGNLPAGLVFFDKHEASGLLGVTLCLELGDVFFDTLRFSLKLLQIFFKIVNYLFPRNKAPVKSHTPVMLVTSTSAIAMVVPSSVHTVMAVSSAPAISTMTLLPLAMMLSMMLAVLTTTTVFFLVHLTPPHYKSISADL